MSQIRKQIENIFFRVQQKWCLCVFIAKVEKIKHVQKKTIKEGSSDFEAHQDCCECEGASTGAFCPGPVIYMGMVS